MRKYGFCERRISAGCGACLRNGRRRAELLSAVTIKESSDCICAIIKAASKCLSDREVFLLRELAAVIEQLEWKGWILCEEERLHGKPGDTAMRPARDKLIPRFSR